MPQQLVSEDGEVAYLYFVWNFGDEGWNAVPDAADEVRDIAEIDGVDRLPRRLRRAGLRRGRVVRGHRHQPDPGDARRRHHHLAVHLPQPDPVAPPDPLRRGRQHRSPTGVVYLLAKYADLTVNGQSQAILSILVIGAGTDYALLLVARYREELRRHEDRHEAMAFALHRAAPAILASAATVCVGMLCLSVADLNSTAGLGPVLAVGIAVTFFVMVTLLPALLVICGRWVFWPKRPTFGSRSRPARPLGEGRQTGSRPPARGLVVTTGAPAGVACLGLFRLDTAGLSTEDTYTKEFDSIKGQKVLVETRPRRHLQHGPGRLQRATRSTAVAGRRCDRRPGRAGRGDRRWVTVGPTSRRPITEDISSDCGLRHRRGDPRRGPRASTAPTRSSAAASAFYLDTKIASDRDNKVIIPLVLLVVFLILMALLRAVVAPVILIATVVLSFGAALGISALLFEYVFGFAGADPGLPAVRLRVPGGARHRLQHLPDDPGPRGDREPRHPAGLVDRAVVDRRRDHVGGHGARRDVPRARARCRWCSSPSSAWRSRSGCCSTR